MPDRRVLDEIKEIPKTIGKDDVVEGPINGFENYLVHGEVRGDSDVHGALMLSSKCRWLGHVMADVVVVKGLVEGNITARNKIELRSGAVVNGDIKAPFVSIGHDATLNGAVHPDSHVTHFAERRSS